MKYTATITIPMYLELEPVEVNAETRGEATRKILINLDNDKYHHELCKAIESATENLGWGGLSKNAEVVFYED